MIGYLLKVYPRFSETFVVTEVLAREARGEELAIYALRPTTDPRFHPEIARVKAAVSWVPRAQKASEWWQISAPVLQDPEVAQRFTQILPQLATLPGDEVAQALSLTHTMKTDGIRMIHAHFASLAGRIAWCVSKLSGIPYTVTTHAKDIFHEDVDPLWLRRICEDADRVIAISEFNRQYLEKILPGERARISMQYNALELARFPYSPPRERSASEPLRVAAVGRLVPKKGFDVLLRAAATSAIPLQITLAGSGECDGQLRALCAQLDIQDRVQMPGPLTQSEVAALVSSSDVLVAPCVPAADGNLDGLPTVILEAMALGTPVISTAVTGIPEVIRNGETGRLVPPHDIHALTRALEWIAAHPDESARLAARARALIEHSFDSLKQAATLEKWTKETR